MHDGGRPVLEVQGLKTVFRVRGGEIHAVNNVSFKQCCIELGAAFYVHDACRELANDCVQIHDC